jgi:hypothetical protein
LSFFFGVCYYIIKNEYRVLHTAFIVRSHSRTAVRATWDARIFHAWTIVEPRSTATWCRSFIILDQIIGEVRKIRETGEVRKIRETGEVREVGEVGEVGKIRETGEVRKIRETGEVRKIRETGEVREVRETGEVGETDFLPTIAIANTGGIFEKLQKVPRGD